MQTEPFFPYQIPPIKQIDEYVQYQHDYKEKFHHEDKKSKNEFAIQ